MDDGELTPAERAELERVDALLADPALWAEPPAELQEQVVAMIAHEADRSRRRRLTRYAVGALAASAVLAVAVTSTVRLTRDDPLKFEATMASSSLVPEARGDVTLTRTDSGWRIRLHVEGLPRRSDGRFYEAWLKNDDGQLVSIGTFNQGEHVTLWSGVSPADYRTLTVTREVQDGDPGSSGEVVLMARPERS